VLQIAVHVWLHNKYFYNFRSCKQMKRGVLHSPQDLIDHFPLQKSSTSTAAPWALGYLLSDHKDKPQLETGTALLKKLRFGRSKLRPVDTFPSY